MAEASDRREVILAASATLFARKSVAATTVREIADSVGLLSGSLYHHFASKDQILDDILRGYLDSIRAGYAAVLDETLPPPRRLHDLIFASLLVVERQPEATAIYQNELPYLRSRREFAHVQEAAAEIQRTWLDVIEAGVAHGSFRADVAPKAFYRLIRDAVWLSYRWHHSSSAHTTRDLADDVTSIFLDGFGARSAPVTGQPPSSDVSAVGA